MIEKSEKCKICESPSEYIFSKIILKTYSIKYYQCTSCRFIQTEKPYWLDEAYKNSMNLGDTGQIKRNQKSSEIFIPLVYFFLDRKKKFLDFAAGYGMFTRMMRDIGLDFFWYDKYTENIFAKGFEVKLNELQLEAITVFECFEHWEEPIKELENIIKVTDTIFFTTNLIGKRYPDPESWWYYGFDHGQHLSFYSVESLKFIAKKYNLNFFSKRGFHLLTSKKIPLIVYKILVELSFYGLLRFINNFFESKTNSDHFHLSNQK